MGRFSLRTRYDAPRPGIRFSLRTLLLATMGFAIFCGLSTPCGLSETAIHTLLVLAFAIPGGSYGYDVRPSSRGIAVGASVAAVAGTLTVSAIVLIEDFYRFYW